MWLRSTGPAWCFGSPTGLDLERRAVARRGAGCPARPARAAPRRRRRRGRAAHRAPCGARAGPDREARPATASRARGDADQPERAHRRWRAPRDADPSSAAISAGSERCWCSLPEDQRGVDPDLVRGVVDQRILDVLDLRRLRARRRRRRARQRRQHRPRASQQRARASGRRGEDACKACSGSPGRAIAVNGKHAALATPTSVT